MFTIEIVSEKSYFVNNNCIFNDTLNGFMVDANILSKNYVDRKDMYQAEMDHFVDRCLNGTKCQSLAEEGVMVMKILEALYESAKTGKSVDID